MDLISIIVPVYNSEKYLEKCIKSMVEQSYHDLEIILINDGSKDKSQEICERWEDIDCRIIVINKDNSGVSDTRNIGIESATGKFVMFVDSDDFLERDACLNLYNAIIDSKTQTAIGGYYFDFYSNGNIVKQYNIIPNINHVHEMVRFGEVYGELMDKRIMLSLWGKLYNLNLILNNNIRFSKDIYIGEDMLFNNEYFAYDFSFGVSNHPNYHYTIDNPNSLTKTNDYNRKKNAEFLFRSSLDFAYKMGIFESCASNIGKYYFKSCMINIENAILLDRKSKVRNLNEYIKSIVKSSETQHALSINGNLDVEFNIYKFILLLNSVCILKVFVKSRIIIKKYIRKV